MSTVLKTPRLVLRELVQPDLDFVQLMFAHREVMQFFPRCFTREETMDWVRSQQDLYAGEGHGLWLALERRPRRPVGVAGVVRTEVDKVSEIALGYIVHRPFWRRGLAAEAAAACRDYAFEQLGVSRVITLVRPENLASLGVARKIGMKIERRTIYARYEHFVMALNRADARH